MELDSYPAMKRNLNPSKEVVVVDRVGSTQIERNQMELDLYPAMKRIREIESKPSDRSSQASNHTGADYYNIIHAPESADVGIFDFNNKIELSSSKLSSSQASNRTGADFYNRFQAPKSADIGFFGVGNNPKLSRSKLSPSQASKGTGGMLERKRAVGVFDLPGSSVMEKDKCYSVAKGFIEEPDHLQSSLHSSGLKRILLEYDEIESNPSNDFKCAILERNPYEWQFGIRCASGTKFESGIYHGWIQFPEEYPSKPPSFTLLTENGRNKIRIRRLNDWQPSWRVRDGLLALIDEMPTYLDGELGSVECSREERLDLAIKSRAAAPKYGTGERQKVIDEIHEYLLSKSPPVPVPQLQLTRNTPCQEEVVVDRVGSTQMEWDRSVIAEDKCNIKNSGEKRILEEYNEIESNPSYDFKCLKLDWNPYEWQFAIRGPSGTEFEGGIYHGVVQFSKGYPSKPPSIKFLTKNGRLKIHTDISSRLLSNWQSPRSVRNALLALIEEMPTYPDGDDELGSVKYNKEERRDLAIKSREAAPKCDTSKRQKLIDEIHEYMLSKAPPVPQLQLSSPSQASKEHEHEHYQNDGAKRKHGRGDTSLGITNFGNTIHAIDSKRVGITNFGNTIHAIDSKRVGITNVGNTIHAIDSKRVVLYRVFLSSSIIIGFSSILFGFWSFRG